MLNWIDINKQLPVTKKDIPVLVLERKKIPITIWNGREYKETGKFKTNYYIHNGWWDARKRNLDILLQ